MEEHTLLCIAYGEGVVLIIDVVRANEFFQDEIGICTSPDPSVCSKLVRDVMPDLISIVKLIPATMSLTSWGSETWGIPHQQTPP